LQTPREHLNYLKSHGRLEPFVEANLLGKEPEAKWLLLDVAKLELDVIEKKKLDKLEQENLKK
jgi:hypothetical protein